MFSHDYPKCLKTFFSHDEYAALFQILCKSHKNKSLTITGQYLLFVYIEDSF